MDLPTRRNYITNAIEFDRAWHYNMAFVIITRNAISANRCGPGQRTNQSPGLDCKLVRFSALRPMEIHEEISHSLSTLYVTLLCNF